MKSRAQLRFTDNEYPLEIKVWVIPPHKEHIKKLKNLLRVKMEVKWVTNREVISITTPVDKLQK